MKQTKQLDMAQEQMRPGLITHHGFLGNDTRKLGDIIEHDDVAVRRLGLTHAKIAAKMQELTDEGKKGLGKDVRVGDSLEIRVDSARGKLPCPFLHKGLFEKTFTIVRNTKSGLETVYTDLNVHLISEHGFYEGKGSPYRLEPDILAKELQIRI